MKKYIFSLVCLCCALLPALEGQAHEYPNHPELRKSDANIVGHILDKNTKEHLSYITVALKGTTIGTVTDATGHYFLKNLPEGNFVLEVSSVGYKTVRRNVTLKKGRTLEEDFEIEEDAVALDGVVVSANRNETTRRLAPTLVNVVDLKIFENTNSTTLAQGLSFQPGVRVESNCQNCGFQQVRINGLDGPYTQILLDSRPIFSALSGVYGIEQIPASMIERVEVMRGGGSALFGSSAIAGTINIITKEPIRNSGMLSHTITGIGDGDAFDNSTALNASLVTDNQRAGLYIFGQNRHRSAYDHDGDGYSEIPKIHGQTIGFRSFLKTTTYSKLTFEYHHMEEFRRGGDLLNRPPHEANVAEQTEHSINGGGLKFDYFSPNEKHRFNVFASAQHINRDSYYGGGQDLNAYGNTTDLNWMAGSQYVYSFAKCIFMPSDLTAGIEFNQDKLEDLESQIDILSIVGSCTSIGALKDAEVGKCDLYIAVNPQEDQNINSAILAKKLGAKRTIARVNNSEYLEIENAEYLRSIGIDSLIYPERLAAEEIVASLKQIGSRQMHEFSDGRLQLLGIKLWDNALILNHTLIKMAEIYGADQFRIVAIKRHNHTIIPRGNDELKYGDLVFIVTRPSFISNVFALCGKEQFEIKNIVIVGASRIGIKTASLLEKNYHVKIIEKDREKCIQLADKLKSTLVINGDGRDLTLLREEGIKNVDAFISLTGSSETNILSCLLAKKMGVKKSVAEVENIDYIDLAENIGIGTLINTKLIAASHIYRYTMNVDVRHLKFLTFSEAEVFELEAQPGSKITKYSLQDVHFPDDATVGGVFRGDETIIAKGDVQIQAGDTVVIFALQNAVKKVIKYFQ